VILGTGVGGGVVVGGRLVSGPNGLTGEWGHVPLPRFPAPADDRVESRLVARSCYCGRVNCIETFLSGPGLARTHQELWTSGLTAEEIYRAAALDAEPLAAAVPDDVWSMPLGPREQARATLTVWCGMLARSLAQIVNVLDPDVIVLGGGLSNMRGIYEPVRSLLALEVFGGICATPILPPRHGDASGVRGAAWLWDDVPS
jgi:fructokinase